MQDILWLFSNELLYSASKWQIYIVKVDFIFICNIPHFKDPSGKTLLMQFQSLIIRAFHKHKAYFNTFQIHTFEKILIIELNAIALEIRVEYVSRSMQTVLCPVVLCSWLCRHWGILHMSMSFSFNSLV